MRKFTKKHRENLSRSIKIAYKIKPFNQRTQMVIGNFGTKHFGWKGGKIIHKNGYIDIYVPFHPTCKYNYKLEHRLVIESHLNKVFLKNGLNLVEITLILNMLNF
jgi:hypothetical protein